MDKSPEAFRTISEVADTLDVPPHVLRFWETRFLQVKPVKRGGGRRYYRPEDVRLLRGIRGLLYDDGMTIKGVQKILREKGVRHVVGLGTLPESEPAAAEFPYDLPAAAPEPANGPTTRPAAPRRPESEHAPSHRPQADLFEAKGGGAASVATLTATAEDGELQAPAAGPSEDKSVRGQVGWGQVGRRQVAQGPRRRARGAAGNDDRRSESLRLSPCPRRNRGYKARASGYSAVW